MNRIVWLVILALAAPAALAEERAYRLEEVPLPRHISPEVSAVAFSPTGTLFIANRHGDIWFQDQKTKAWRRFAHGLHEAMGLVVQSDREVYVSHKPELTRLVDTQGDGVADQYETIADGWGHTDNWHEHAFGLRRDRAGNFVMALGLADLAGPVNTLWPRVPLNFDRVAAEQKQSIGPHQGWLFKVAPDGKITPWAYGFREPCGIGLSPEGEIFITDQQGDYIPSSALVHIERGKFYGHPASAKWSAHGKQLPLSHAQLTELRTPEAVILPHGSMGGSPGEPVWDTTAGRFGPFAGQVFVGDFTRLISRIDLEQVDGTWQGACFTFLRDAVGAQAIAGSSGANNLAIPAGRDGRAYFRDVDEPLPGVPLRQGNMRMAFAPDGSLYVGQTTRGWGVGDGLQRIVWTGSTPAAIHSMRLTEKGFRLRFTTPMDRSQASDPANYSLGRFRYVYHGHYGSPRVEEADVAIVEVKVNDTADQVELELSELQPGFIHELEIRNLHAADGRELESPYAYYTLNRTHDGRTFEGSVAEGVVAPPKVVEARDPDPRLGGRVYRTFCIQCHRADGRGGGLPGVQAADFTRLDGPLTKTDQQLAERITQGIVAKGMPPFGYVLQEQQILDVLAYLRTTFAPAEQDAAGQ